MLGSFNVHEIWECIPKNCTKKCHCGGEQFAIRNSVRTKYSIYIWELYRECACGTARSFVSQPTTDHNEILST